MANISFRKIFFPYAHEKSQIIKSEGSGFAYYTTAEVAYSILTNRCIWMRSCSTMNDYLEVKYGEHLLHKAKESDSGKKLDQAVDACYEGLFAKAWNSFEQEELPKLVNNTYLTCVTEHSKDEDDIGRLSMWRAYGGKTGIALVVFKKDIFEKNTSDFGIYASPVAYLSVDQFCKEMEKVAEKIQEYSDYIKGNLSEHCVEEYLLEIFTNAVICTKHPGFSEEKEWRIIHSLGHKQSQFIEKEIKNIKGVPQIIYKIPFYKNITGLALTDLIDRVIIGPCEFPDVTYQAICSVLSEAGMTSPEEIIKKSEIPLRQS